MYCSCIYVYVIMRCIYHVALVVLGVDVQRVYVCHELYTLHVAAILPHLSLSSILLVKASGSSTGH